MPELMLSGDVMLGRGVDQILPSPGDPRLQESSARSALDYVALAERASGRIPRGVAFSYVWGDALAELERRRPFLRIVNLETAVTRRGTPAAKGIHYRMEPANLPVLHAAGIDCCVLANNHVLDWGPEGLLDTLDGLAEAGHRSCGAGRDAASAAAPAIFPRPGGGRVVVHAAAFRSSGVPPDWAAAGERPGVNYVEAPTEEAAERLAGRILERRQAGDATILSVHWGGNWGYGVPMLQQLFARRLIDRGAVDVVHGHSSHHRKAIELYRGRPILYGAGDLLNDYEGIGGYPEYRSGLVLLYFITLEDDGRLAGLELVPFRVRRFRLRRAGEPGIAWLHQVLDGECRRFGGRVHRVNGLLRFAAG